MLSTFNELRQRINDHNVMITAAGIAFYGLLALVPTLVAIVSLYALFADPENLQSQLQGAESLDPNTKAFLADQLDSVVGQVDDQQNQSGKGVGQLFGLLGGTALALFSTSGAVQKLLAAVASAYESDESRPVWELRGVAFLFTTGAIAGAALLVLVFGVVPRVLDQVDLGAGLEWLITIFLLPLLGVLFAAALTAMYRYWPDRPRKTPWKNVGALVGTALFMVFALALRVYAGNVGLLPASYGFLGSVLILMFFLQFSSLAVIVGAEVNAMVEPTKEEASH